MANQTSSASQRAETAQRGPRLLRRVVDVDGRRVGVAVAGTGTPLVVVHGFGVESLLYAQPLARLAARGFRVIAIDVAGHGATAGIGWLPEFGAYTDLVARTIETLDIDRAVLVGHSMGGRIVAEIAAERPALVAKLVLMDAILGEPWELWRRALRLLPPLFGGYGAAFAMDLLGTVPVASNARQALILGQRVRPSIVNFATRPIGALITGQAILRAASATPYLDRLRAAGMPAVVMHGERDRLVPMRAARDTARRLSAPLVTVHRGSHSWMLRDPETLPAIFDALLAGAFGDGLTPRPTAAPSDASKPPTRTRFTIEAPTS